MWEIEIIEQKKIINNNKNWSIESKEKIITDILSKLEDKWVNSDKLADKLKEWLDAKTLNSRWDVMEDSKAQQRAFEYIMQMQWIKLWQQSVNVNFINMPKPDEPLRY